MSSQINADFIDTVNDNESQISLVVFPKEDYHAQRIELARKLRAMKSIMGAISESQIDTIAKNDAPPVTKEMAEFWFMSSSIESQIQLLERFCKYGGLGDYNINKAENETKLHLRHGLGRSFSRMLAGVFGTLFQSVNSQVEAEENSITIVLRNRVKRKK